MKLVLPFLSLFFTASVFAAPLPATSTSSIISEKKGGFFSEIGFKMNAAETDWQLSPKPGESKYMVTMYRAPEAYKSVHASLTVRLDRLGQEAPLDDYVKKWLRRYPRFGFTVLGAKNFTNRGQPGYVVDLINKENERQLRQVIFLRDKAAIVMTCRDHVENFQTSLKNCNEIIRTFEWVPVENAPPAPEEAEVEVES